LEKNFLDQVNFLYKNRETDWFPNPLASNSSHSKFLKNGAGKSNPDKPNNISFTESQNGRGWKGPLWVIQSNPPAEAGSPTAGFLFKEREDLP